MRIQVPGEKLPIASSGHARRKAGKVVISRWRPAAKKQPKIVTVLWEINDAGKLRRRLGLQTWFALYKQPDPVDSQTTKLKFLLHLAESEGRQ
jgi:hypothetical protein